MVFFEAVFGGGHLNCPNPYLNSTFVQFDTCMLILCTVIFHNQAAFILLQVDELARVITNLCTIVPGGIVCFFPSYDYENMVCSKWESTGIIEKIGKKKQVSFR